MREFGELLRVYRVRAGLTQQQLAGFATLSVRAIRDLESGRTRIPRTGTVRLLLDGLGLDEEGRLELQEALSRGAAVTAVAPPAPLNAIIGRESETAALMELLATGRQRLVTVVGVSGAGKTRFVLEVAAQLHARCGWSVHWNSGDRGRDLAVADDQDTLLVVEDAADQVRLTGLLQRHRRLRVVVTALAPGQVPGEQVFPLGPLEDAAAVRLLLSQVRRVRPGYQCAEPAVLVDLVRELDGLPSAVEFAAGWFMVYPAGELLDRLRRNPLDPTAAHLRDSLRLTIGGLDAQQRFLLSRLVSRVEPWPADEVGFLAQELLVRGLLRRAGRSLEVLHLVRAAVSETACSSPQALASGY